MLTATDTYRTLKSGIQKEKPSIQVALNREGGKEGNGNQRILFKMDTNWDTNKVR